MNKNQVEPADDLLIWHTLSEAYGNSDAADSQGELSAHEASEPRDDAVRQCLQVLNEMWSAESDSADHAPANGPASGKAVDSASDLPVEQEAGLRHFGRFLVGRRLGRGGHGLVFRAVDPLLRRDVALKIPNPSSLASAELRRRFVEESRMLARLEHPNLLPILEAGTVGPVCYLATPLCAGPSLAEWLRSQQKPLRCESVARLVRDLARTVDYVHSRGILHRDIKPGNVLLEPMQGLSDQEARQTFSFTPKLTDFGLAKLVAGPASQTATGALLGTPGYMAPEQAAGRQADIGMATDIYALGAVLYELLTDRPPFRGRSELETLRLISEGRLAPPQRLRADVPRDLSAICLKCLEFEPSHRYRSAHDLADDLMAFLEARPVQARSCGAVGRLIKWGRRRPLVAALAASLLLSTTLGMGVVGWQWRRAEHHRQEAEENFLTAHAAIKRFHDLLFEEHGYYGTPESYGLRKDVLAAAIPYYNQLLERKPASPALTADLAGAFLTLGHVAVARDGSRPEALELFRKSAGLWQRLVDEDPTNREYRRLLGKAHGRIGILMQEMREESEATACEQLQLAAAIHEQLVRESPSDIVPRRELAQTLSALVLIHTHRKDFDAAARTAERALEVLLEIPPEETLRDPRIRYCLDEAHRACAKVYYASGDYEQAAQHCHEALELCRHLVEQNEAMPTSAFHLVRSLELMARTSAKLGDDEKSLALFREAIGWMEGLVSAHPDLVPYRHKLAFLCNSLGRQYRRQKRFEEALQVHREAHRWYEQLAREQPATPDYHCQLVQSHYSIARLHNALGRHEDAVAALDQGKELVGKLPPQAFAALADKKYFMVGLFGSASRIRTAAGEPDGGPEAEWHRTILKLRQQTRT